MFLVGGLKPHQSPQVPYLIYQQRAREQLGEQIKENLTWGHTDLKVWWEALVKTERSFAFDFLFINLPQYAKKNKHTVNL